MRNRRSHAPYILAASMLSLAGAATSQGATSLRPSPNPSQDPRTQITASVEVVRLNVAVLAPPGLPIPPLTVEDFKVYDNDTQQDIELIWRPTDTPLHVALVFDMSPSVRPWWPSVRRAALTFLLKLSPADCPYVLPFSDAVGPGRWGRYSTNEWTDFLAHVDPGSGTSLHDALLFALYHLDLADEIAAQANAEPDDASPAEQDPEFSTPKHDGEATSQPVGMREVPTKVTRAMLLASISEIVAKMLPDSRETQVGNCDLRGKPGDGTIKAILLLSDGADTTSDTSFDTAMTAARLANVPVFPVLLGTAANDAELRAALSQIASATGGLLTTDVAPARLSAAYNDVLAYLRSTYILSYTLTDSANQKPEDQSKTTGEGAAWHEVRVELRRPLLRTIVRPGYYR